MKIAPSILSCDFANMGRDVKAITDGGADMVHLDVMDGNFVPNISFGPAVIKSIRGYTDLPFDVHLMIEQPHRYIDEFAKAGADIITFHVEAEDDIAGTIKKINDKGIKAGLTLKPKTPIEKVLPYIDSLYMVLIMTVEPGFGGQSFMYDMMDKVQIVKDEARKKNTDLLIEVDGGINFDTISVASESGVDICVAGTSVFNKGSICDNISRLKANAL